MKARTVMISCAAALALSACGQDESQNAQPASSGSTASAPTQPQSNTPTTPANAGAPTAAERRDGANPTQQQVDPKERAQHRDFQQRGDQSGPRSAETAPRN